MWIVSGCGGGRMLDDLWMFDPEAALWHRIEAKGERPEPRCRHTATVLEGQQLFVFGGWDWNRAFRDAHALDLETATWRRVRLDGAVERIWHTAVRTSAGDVLVFAGEDKDTYLQNSLFAVRGGARWERVGARGESQPPTDRYGHGAVLRGREMLVFGGYGGEMTLFNDLFAFNVEAQQWIALAAAGRAPQRRYGHSMCALPDGRVFITGGKTLSMAGLADHVELVDGGGAVVAAAPRVAAPAAEWDCEVCTLRNGADARVCAACGSARRGGERRVPEAESDESAPEAEADEDSRGDEAEQRQRAEEEHVSESSSSEESAEDAAEWSCAACTFRNAGGEVCEMCGTRRE
jgi:N-acetylneuraminic acid mutarotase